MSASVQNLEEAASIAVEFISSLDNLPSEAHHLLQEIRHKEVRSQEIQLEIAKESAKYIRHSLRHASVPPSPSTPAASSSAAPSPSTPAPGPKAHLPPKIATSFAEIDRLAVEQLALSQRIVDLIARTKARLDSDLAKVGVLQGDTIDAPKPGFGAPLPLVAAGLGGADGYVLHGRNPALQISESLRNALAASPTAEIALPATASAIGPSAPKSKREK
jgi:chromatin modification-related protein YNG2